MRPNESFIEQPVRSLQTMLRILAQDDPKYVAVVPDGIYGPATTQAVAAFQRQNELSATGAADQNTWDAIVAEYEAALVRVGKAEPIEILLEPGQILRHSDNGPYVYLLQSILIYLSQDHVAIRTPVHTGIFDDETRSALRDFQKITDLPETGELDRLTWKYLVRHFTANAHHNNRVTGK